MTIAPMDRSFSIGGKMSENGDYSETQPCQFKKLNDYEAALGTSVENVVYEAVSDFIECGVSNSRLNEPERNRQIWR